MKKPVIVLSLSFLMIGAMVSSGQTKVLIKDSANDKVKHSKITLAQTNVELVNTPEDTVTAYQTFVNESEVKIKSSEKKVADLKVEIDGKDQELRADLQKQLRVLDDQNKDLKKRLGESSDDRSDEWLTFKSEFNIEMESLGNALDNFFNTMDPKKTTSLK